MKLPDEIQNSLMFREVDISRYPEPEPGRRDGCPVMPIHVWSGKYADLGSYSFDLAGLLHPDETARAGACKKSDDAQKYIIRHGLVRAVLGSYLRKNPRAVRFVYGENGKPELDPGQTIPGIRFSLSTTDEMFSLAVSHRFPTGLDIVNTARHYSFSEIEGYIFTQAEREWIGEEPPSHRSFRFYRIWALKEALLKAAGADVNSMRELDVAGIMRASSLNGWYPVKTAWCGSQVFIQESSGCPGHHQVIACLQQ